MVFLSALVDSVSEIRTNLHKDQIRNFIMCDDFDFGCL